MKKFWGVCLIFALFQLQPVFAEGNIIKLDKNNISKTKINVKSAQKHFSGSLLINDSETIEKIIDIQNKHDLRDLEKLWQGTLKNNAVLEIALKKLSVPEAQRKIQYSLKEKALSAIVSSVSFIPCITGANYGIQTTALSAGHLAQSFINRKKIPQQTPLTDTELIELAYMIESLQDSLVSSYYNYKNTLNQLKEIRSKMVLYNRNYSKSLEGDDILEVAISSSLHNSMFMQEFTLKQDAKKYYMQLQRLAGKNVVDELELYQYNFDYVLYKEK